MQDVELDRRSDDYHTTWQRDYLSPFLVEGTGVSKIVGTGRSCADQMAQIRNESVG
jgi:hypothetical protein